MSGWTMIAFPLPFLEIDATDVVVSTQLYVLSRDAALRAMSEQSDDVRKLLTALVFSQEKLKLQARVGGSLHLTWSLMIKTFALVATIIVVADELISSDDSSGENFRNCTCNCLSA
ncbi:uncharacterized protein LOC129584454 [Paramacrobiotus metropolitanus]|uniref:uncharacterized protein LOC129584454 n=1 Tax=Paramacrobiotus metropolitanus TaxID=2943436 RepID=UPI00244614CD|nr:uncharacterized protein LOC129584454 [Paramacrobiotus metropolitanus]